MSDTVLPDQSNQSGPAKEGKCLEPENSILKAEESKLIDKDNIENARLEIEKSKLEIERAKLEIERMRAEREQRFWYKHSATLITALVSLAAVIVSSGQVLSTWIAKNRELQIASIQKQVELEMADKQKAKELAILEEQHKREWNLNTAKFVTENRRIIFNGNPEERILLAKIIPTIFPEDISLALLTRLETVSAPEAKNTWRVAKRVLTTPEENVSDDKQIEPKKVPLPLSIIEALVFNQTPDAVIAAEIRARGIAFRPSLDILQRLRRLGAGPKTIQTLAVS